VLVSRESVQDHPANQRSSPTSASVSELARQDRYETACELPGLVRTACRRTAVPTGPPVREANQMCRELGGAARVLTSSRYSREFALNHLCSSFASVVSTSCISCGSGPRKLGKFCTCRHESKLLWSQETACLRSPDSRSGLPASAA